MKKLKIFLYIVASIALVALIYYYYLNFINGKTISPKQGEVVYAVYATGNVEPTYWAKIAPLQLGEIVEIKVIEGQKVKANDILAIMDDKIEKQKLEELKARISYFEKEKSRLENLVKQNAVSKSDFDKINYEYLETKAKLAAQERKLSKNLKILSPIDGTVLRKEVNVGEIVDPNDNIFFVGKAKPIRIIAEVDEEDIPQIKIGQKALIKADAFENKVIEGSVQSVTPFGDPINKNFRVYIDLPENTNLYIGMTVEINITIKKVQDALLIPTKSILDDFVFIKLNGKPVKRKVQTGAESNGDTHIIDGLNLNDKVFLNPENF